MATTRSSHAKAPAAKIAAPRKAASHHADAAAHLNAREAYARELITNLKTEAEALRVGADKLLRGMR